MNTKSKRTLNKYDSICKYFLGPKDNKTPHPKAP